MVFHCKIICARTIPPDRYLKGDWKQGGCASMECKMKNDIGTIYITEDVMLKVAGYAALECYGIVAMCSKRATDGLVEWLGREI